MKLWVITEKMGHVMKILGLLGGLLFAMAVYWPNAATGQTAAPSGSARAVPRGGQSENRWRYVWHNDRWWYWTAEDRWDYFDRRRWRRYDARRPPSDALALGYRRAPAFEKPPAAPPRPPMSLPSEGIERETGLVDLFDLGGAGQGAGLRFGGGALPSVSGAAPGLGGVGRLGGTGGAVGGRVGGAGGMSGGRGTSSTGGGGFGGPTGSSLGAGSAAGGASSPH